ncbi:hypothetical protein CN138_09065 [Sinorhizobium meliloti]|uniref:hypothetical protein n=1 Tax=Rhizobium meliloti TaxID=382 RepID=UPI000FD6E715|nr:hypothetical protein [Sinorhizobium meliloti]RVL72403.1 hypothetical protein CN138_09065 [Sinorhizobium meliloti]
MSDIEDLLSGLKAIVEEAAAKKRKSPKKKIYSEKDETPEFVQFWETWRPHARQNDGRGLARECFLKQVSNGADPQAIADGARYFFRTMKERDREYIPLAATWLNRGAYEDLAVQERAYQKRISSGNVVSMAAKPANYGPAEIVSPPEPISPEEAERRRQMVARLRAEGVIGRTMQ